MKYRSGQFLAVLLSRLWAQGYDPATAFAEGKALGASSLDPSFQGIGRGTAAATVPGFGATAPQSQHFQAGQGQLSGPGVARVTACATLPPEVDAYRRQECEAVNFVARNPSLRPAFSIDRANDPLISRANAVARHPTMASTGVTAGSGAENCRVVTETTPASVTRETCSDYRPVTSKSCSTVRQIQVDQHHRYQCVEQMPDDCAAIKATEGCVLVGSTCDSTAVDGSCKQATRTYRCTNGTVPTSPPTVVALDTSYTIVSNTLDTSACTSLAQSSHCVHAAQTCTDDTPCKTINGLQVCLNTVSPLPAGAQSAGDACWAWSEDYTCAATALSHDCQKLIDRGCTPVASDCLDRAASGACEMSERTYACQTSPATETRRRVCDQSSFCPGGAGCFETSHPADEDFGRVVATLEAAREAGVYGADQRLFTGVAEQCRKKLFGVVNCCRKGGGTAKSNNAVMSAAIQGASAGGQLAVNAGSKYLFDFMYPQYAGYVEAGMQAMISSEVLFTPTNFQPSFSFYGLTLSTGTMSTGLLGGPIYSLGTVGPFNFYFDPYSLAIAVAMQLISELLSCQEAEKLLATHREANLCVPVGSFCSRRVPIIRTCIEQTQSYCCFNSRLARIINEQGRGQVGKGWGSGKRPDCSGFTPEEFEQIDFSRIDLSEFIAEVVASVRVPSASAIGQNVQSTVQQRVESYYRR